MLNIIQIFRDNGKTFYDFGTDKPRSRLAFWILTIFLSIFFAIVLSYPSNEFLNAIITTQSILAGFGFNVMFFLLSSSNTLEVQENSLLEPNSKSIEESLLDQKLQKLSEEIFWNISYFNLISVLSVFIALVALIPTFTASFISQISYLPALLPESLNNSVVITAKWLVFIFVSSLKACIYIFTIECIYTFVRTISRINYYFRKKIDKNKRTKVRSANV